MIYSYFEHFVKEFVEFVMRYFRRKLVGSVPHQHYSIINEVKLNGISVVEDYWPIEKCKQAIQAIEGELAGSTTCQLWVDTEGADHRLWHAERIGGILESFLNDIELEELRLYYSGVSKADKLLLAARLNFVPNNQGSGGGWHRDSPHRSQFKAILYLNDVGIDNGPFEYLMGSHAASKSFELLRIHQTHPNQYRFTDEEINAAINNGEVCRTFVARAGTLLLVDTKGIHRGRPIDDGTRYALTSYCFDGARPKDFLK
uniref:phytanoyl-CoA dioxygenase family protein n=1 Tax=Polynucleobacter sp. TaxID=2029855 RepID=UPI0040475499